MKRLTILLAVLPFFNYAQTEKYDYNLFQLNRLEKSKYEDPLAYEGRMLNTIKGKEVTSITKTVQHKNKYKAYTTRYELNAAQKTTRIVYHDGKEMNFTYLYDTLIASVTRPQKKKFYNTNYSYNTDGELLLRESFLDNQLKSRTVLQYNNNGDVLFASMESPSKNRNYTMKYEYNDEKLVHQRYMKNEKVLKEWDFSCKPEGEEIKQDNLSNVCIYTEESNDGSFIVYNRKMSNDKTVLTKSYFKADSSWIKAEIFGNNDVLLSFNERIGNQFHYTRYTEKGKIEYQSITTFNDNKQIVSIKTIRKGNPKKSTTLESTYDENGLLTKETSTYRNKIQRQTSYQYEM